MDLPTSIRCAGRQPGNKGSLQVPVGMCTAGRHQRSLFGETVTFRAYGFFRNRHQKNLRSGFPTRRLEMLAVQPPGCITSESREWHFLHFPCVKKWNYPVFSNCGHPDNLFPPGLCYNSGSLERYDRAFPDFLIILVVSLR